MDHINIKVSLGGETGVGKTSFSNKFLYKKFDYTETTIGASFLTKETTFNNKLYKFNKKKLTNKEYLERYIASVAGGLYSCVSDFIKLLSKKSII